MHLIQMGSIAFHSTNTTHLTTPTQIQVFVWVTMKDTSLGNPFVA